MRIDKSDQEKKSSHQSFVVDAIPIGWTGRPFYIVVSHPSNPLFPSSLILLLIKVIFMSSSPLCQYGLYSHVVCPVGKSDLGTGNAGHLSNRLERSLVHWLHWNAKIGRESDLPLTDHFQQAVSTLPPDKWTQLGTEMKEGLVGHADADETSAIALSLHSDSPKKRNHQHLCKSNRRDVGLAKDHLLGAFVVAGWLHKTRVPKTPSLLLWWEIALGWS